MAILDAWGNPIRQADIKSPQTSRVARYERPWHDTTLRGLKPRDVARLLADADAGDLPAQARLFADMLDRDAMIAAAMQQRALAVARLPWKVEPPANATSAETRATKAVAEWLAGMADALEDTAVALMEAAGFGYSAAELVWRYQGGQWMPDIWPRPHDWLTSSDDGRELYLVTDAGSEPLQPFGWIVHQPRSPRAGYLSRGGMFRALVWPFVYKAYAIGDFAEFLETFGLPFVIGKYGREATEEDKARLLSAVASLSHDARAIMPLEMQLEIQRVQASGGDSPHLAMVRWADEAIARAILGQTLSTQARSTGLGSGVADLQAEVRRDIRDADARQLAATLTRDLIYPWCALNLGLSDAARAPRLVYDTAETEDISTYAQAIPQLAAAGVPIPVDWVRERLGIPAPQQGQAVVGAAAPAGTAGIGVAGVAALVARNAGTGADYSGPEDDPTPVSLMVDRMDTEGADAWREIMDAVRRLVDEADSLSALRDALLAAYGDLPSDRLAEVMALGFAAAHLAGRYDVDRGA